MKRDKKEDYYTFVLFLKQYNALTTFKEYFLECGGIYSPTPLTLKNYISTVNSTDWIFFAFNWSKTREGDNFWCKLSDLWREIINIKIGKRLSQTRITMRE